MHDNVTHDDVRDDCIDDNSNPVGTVPKAVHSVLTHYGQRIPTAIGAAVRSTGAHHPDPETVAVLRLISDTEITDALRVYLVVDSDGGDVFLFRYNSAGKPNVYYTLTDGVIGSCLHRLCSETSLVIESCDDEYDPYMEDNSDGER